MKQAIVNCHLYDGKTASVQDNITILWEDGIIKEIGEELELPSEVDIIDGTGHFVTPGLIHSFTQVGLKEYGIRWEGDDSYEASNTIQPLLSVLDGINPFDHTFEIARQYGITTVHVAPGPENIISGKTAIIKTVGSVIDKMVVEADHGLAVSLGEVPKGAYRNKFKTPITRMRIAYLIREQLRKALYDDQSDAAKEDIFQRILKKSAPLYIRAHRADDIVTALRLKKEFNINVVLVHGTEANKVIDVLKDSDTPIIAGPFYSPKSREELKNITPATTAEINKANIPFSLISTATRNLTVEGALSVRENVARDQALGALTLQAAKILGISAKVGSVEVGKEADLVLWNNKPLELKSAVTRTIIAGTTVFERDGALT